MGEELISKKELLSLTGISYGQLYRWKRQKLIPESWFIKQATTTGQETYFVKEKILKRISFILNNKEKYSLEELASILSPTFTDRRFPAEELRKIPWLDEGVIDQFQQHGPKDYFTFMEMIVLAIMSKWKQQWKLEEKEMSEWAASIKKWLPQLKNTSYRLIMCQKNREKLYLLADQNASFFLDDRTQELETADLDEWGKELHRRLSENDYAARREGSADGIVT
ncbi:DUF4004 family protein [Paenactinomyces guangxiensis]|uniref:DUF4004 family protein n=1 Tax=Paenactinomyces guangxiensis TaxID=1490290 RepID=A0A7W2A843_9BACL|nr:DUF4004 family protein [Paenactinomyces guangxiensis]MBA4495211.1 DUF4004 family protein [Paenactinomyces guangxiensis]MBH8592295.1 DUF4004 family protein [Paenactinomyces guangxiensis]